MQNSWIPIETPPKKEGYYLTYDPVPPIMGTTVRVEFFTFFNHIENANHFSSRNVTHWQPLMGPEKEVPVIHIDWIIHIVSKEVGIRKETIMKRCNKRDAAFSRQLICYLARKYTLLSFQAMIEAVGLTNHTTAMHSVEVITDILCSKEPRKVLQAKLIRELEYKYFQKK